MLTPQDGSFVSDLQDPKKIVSVVQSCVAALNPKHAARVTKIALCGQMHGVVLWKADDVSDCSPLVTWQDQRCSREFLEKELPKPDSHLRLATGGPTYNLVYNAACSDGEAFTGFLRKAQEGKCGIAYMLKISKGAIHLSLMQLKSITSLNPVTLLIFTILPNDRPS